MARAGTSCLRVAFVAGSLTQGGAEKQLLYGVRALRDLGADVRVYSLTRGEHYEPALADAGAAPLWVGRHGLPAVRVMTLARRLRQFEPHIVQSTHFFANLYAALGSRGRRRVGVGALRNDTTFEVDANGRWGKWLLRLPPVLIANSFAARRNAAALGRPPDRIFVVPNAIDLAAFDRGARQPEGPDLHGEGSIVAMTVARLVPQKRVDRFLDALATARTRAPRLRGVVVGDGPERPALERRAADLGLRPDALRFLGRRDDVAGLLRRADVFVLSSDHEGFPNVLLEAMAARLPVVTTAAGDAARLVESGGSGWVVDSAEPAALADALARLAADRDCRLAWGAAGRRRVEAGYDLDAFGRRLWQTYREIADCYPSPHLAAALVH